MCLRRGCGRRGAAGRPASQLSPHFQSRDRKEAVPKQAHLTPQNVPSCAVILNPFTYNMIHKPHRVASATLELFVTEVKTPVAAFKKKPKNC